MNDNQPANDDKLEYLLNKYELMENGLPAFGDLQTTKDRFRDEIRQYISDGIGADQEHGNGQNVSYEAGIDYSNQTKQLIRTRLGL